MNPTTKIPLELTLGEIEIVLSALGELPLKVSANVFAAVRMQRDAAVRKPLSVVEGT